jgi:hypothetical protein
MLMPGCIINLHAAQKTYSIVAFYMRAREGNLFYTFERNSLPESAYLIVY